jgi:hypothetical protein
MNKRLVILTVAFSLAAVMLGVTGCSAFSPDTGANSPDLKYLGNISQQNQGIWVTGTGKISVTPDLADLDLGVEVQAASVSQAQQEAAVAMAAVMASLKSNGVADKDITTRYYNIYPVYSYERETQTLIGYRVNNAVTVKVRNVADTGKIIDSAVAAGGDAIRVNSISFTVANPEQHAEAVRKLAMADADTKAKQLASLAKVKLGKPTYVTESGGSIPPIIYRNDSGIKEGAAPQVTPISAGEIEVTVTVQIIYNIS